MVDRAQHLSEIVRKADPDRHLSVLYAPEDRREALYALYAFDAEIARIRDLISEPMPGEIRLQWWRDVIAAAAPEAAAGHPVASALVDAIARHSLPSAAFANYLDARIFDLYDDPMPGRNELEGYCGETSSALIQLAALILDPVSAPSFSELAGHAGCARCIGALIRAIPMHRARGQCYVPADILDAAGLDRAGYMSGDEGHAMRAMVEAMTSLAREHLRAFQSEAPRLSPSLRPAYLPLAVVPSLLDAVDPDQAWRAPTAEPSALRRQWLMFRHARGGWRANH
jgi:phytoene synthase